MKYLLAALLTILMVFSPPDAAAQPLSLDLTLFNQNAQVFYIGDIDFAGLGNAPNIFRLTIQSLSEQSRDVSLTFKMLVNNQAVVLAQSQVFQLPPNSTNIFTNEQLNTGTAFIRDNTGAPTGQAIDLSNYNLDLDQVENLKNQVISTGKLPAGQYNFYVEATVYENGAPGTTVPDMNASDNILTITNPTTVEPIFPGTRVSQGNLMEIPTTFPYFMWQSDAVLFNLYVYEKYPEDQSIQDVLSHEPMLHVEGYPNQVFQYPADPSPLTFYSPANGSPSGGSVGPIRLLEPGGIYYWYAQAVIETASGQTTLNSDIYQFKIAENQDAAASSELIMTYLRQLLGDRFQQYLQALQGYDPTGNILLNNAPVQYEVFIDLINKMNQDKIKIQNITIE